LAQAVVVEPPPDLFGRVLVGKKVFYSLEPVRSRGGEAVEKCVLVIHEGKIGREFKHQDFLMNARAYQRAPNF
jgi:hypothetical protein